MRICILLCEQKTPPNNKLGQPTATRSSLKCKKANKRPLDCVHSTSFFSVPSDFLLVCPTESDNMVKPRIRWFFINYPFLSKSIYWIYCHRKASFFRKCTFSWYHVGCTCIFGKSVAGGFFSSQKMNICEVLLDFLFRIEWLTIICQRIIVSYDRIKIKLLIIWAHSDKISSAFYGSALRSCT